MGASILTETGEEESFVLLARHIDKVRGGKDAIGDNAESWVSAGSFDRLAASIVPAFEGLFAQGADKDIEGWFNVFCALIQRLESEQQAKTIVDFARAIASSSNHAPLRIRMLVGLFNRLTEAAARHAAFKQLLSFAVSSKYTEVVVPYARDADNWVSEWQLPLDQTRELYILAANVLKEADRGADSLRFLLKYLGTFESSTAADIATAKPHAARAAVEAVRLPDTYQLESVFDLPAVRQLEKDATFAREYQLLKIFAQDKLADFISFYKKEQAFASGAGITLEDGMKKMRLLTLCSLALEKSEIPYSTVATALQIEESEVEAFVIRAISAKLLEAKMDQVRRTIIAGRCSIRVFSMAQWKELRGTLSQMRENIQATAGLLQKVLEDPASVVAAS
eukprot:tig00020903_g15091.t1